MPVTPKDAFEHAFIRAEHFITLYDILHNSRQRDGRKDWIKNFNKFMHWPVRERITRIDGKDKNSILILRADLGIDRAKFASEYTEDLLRSAIVSAISALDKYMHDIIVCKCWALLNEPEHRIPKELANLQISLLTTKKALRKIRDDGKARPGSLVKSALQEMLHADFTFQNVAKIEQGAKILGVKDFWGKMLAEMPKNGNKGDLQNTLKKITKRRNQIVHESDIVRKISAQKISRNTISRKKTIEMVTWVGEFVTAMDTVFQNPQ